MLSRVQVATTYKNKYWRDVFPTSDPKFSWPEAQHLLHIGGESFGPVEPAHGSGLHEHNEEYWIAGTINIQQVYHIHPTLKKEEPVNK